LPSKSANLTLIFPCSLPDRPDNHPPDYPGVFNALRDVLAIFPKPPMFLSLSGNNPNFSEPIIGSFPRSQSPGTYEGVFMSIDIRAERLIDLDEAAKLFPGRDGGTIHPLTVGLYARRGKKGIRL